MTVHTMPSTPTLSASQRLAARDKMPAAQFLGALIAHLLLAAGAIALAAWGDSMLFVLLGGALFGFALVQVGFCGHDIDHRQVRLSRRASTILSLFCWNLVHGVSSAWWRDKHARHHRDTHVLGKDPDLYDLFAHAPCVIGDRPPLFSTDGHPREYLHSL